MKAKNRSPYYADFRRLADVVAAIQAMGAYGKASLDIADWSKRIGEPTSTHSWAEVFKQHPEFFRVGTNPDTKHEYALLRWRHAYDHTYDPEKERELSIWERGQLPVDEKRHLTAKPLLSDQIGVLINTAIELHVRALAHEQENRWLTPLLFGLLGVVLGAVLKL